MDSKPEKDRGSQLRQLMARNLTRMTDNNRLRVVELERYASQGLKTVFDLVPMLLQINHPEVPGYLENADPLRGISGLQTSVFLEKVLSAFPFLRGELSRALGVAEPAVDSLVLMGSSGSVGHTASSDLDYWVCLNRNRFLPGELMVLKKKLGVISRWAAERHRTEVNFYIVDLEALADNRLETEGEETEGEVAPLFLKEEFYRTLLHVAGR
ncbi:MAG: hypothetical protein AB1896_21970, partial [Thermodesulfobacteriota bacterium]